MYHTAIKFGGVEEWEFLWKKYQDTIDPTEKSRMIYALSGSKEPWLLNRLISLVLIYHWMIYKQNIKVNTSALLKSISIPVTFKGATNFQFSMSLFSDSPHSFHSKFVNTILIIKLCSEESWDGYQQGIYNIFLGFPLFTYHALS